VITEIDTVAVALRAFLYLGTILSAGACLFKLSFPNASRAVHDSLRLQMLAGVALVLALEPLRYVLFLLSMAGGDVAVAFAPDMAWMGFEMPPGQASIVRIAGVLTMGLFGLRYLPLGLLGALVVVGSYLFEGHSAASEQRLLMAGLLFVHLGVGHWWIGSLMPLSAATRRLTGADLAHTVEHFGLLATWFVPALLAAGLLLLALLVDWKLDLSNPYQQRFLWKILAVSGVLALAGLNKLRLTPLLRLDPEVGALQLRRSITFEAGLALLVLFLTAFATSTSPEMSP